MCFLFRTLNSTMGKRGTSVGSPSWMAPEVVVSEQKSSGQEVYDNRIDVWAIGK
jgi:myosin-3